MGQPRWTPRSRPRTQGHMHSEGRILCRASRHFIRRATSFQHLLHPSSWPTFLFFRDFLFCLRNFHVRCSRTQPHFWERTVSACIIHICSMFPPPPLLLLQFLLAYFSFLFLCAPLCDYVLSIWRAISSLLLLSLLQDHRLLTDLATSCVKNWRN
jgi:hypothetical protein